MTFPLPACRSKLRSRARYQRVLNLFAGAGDTVFLNRAGTAYNLGYHIGAGRYAVAQIAVVSSLPLLTTFNVYMPCFTAERDNVGMAYVNTWTDVDNVSAYAGHYKQTTKAGATVTYTTPTGVTKIGARTFRNNLCGFVVAYLNGDSTLCTSLRTAQSYVDDGTLAATCLVANGGTLNPTDRIFDGYGASASIVDDVTLLAENLTPAAYTVQLKNTAYKRTAATGARMMFSGIAYVTSTITTTTNAAIDWRTHIINSVGTSWWDWVWLLPDHGGLTGGGHGGEVLDAMTYYVDDVAVTPDDAQTLFGASAEIRRTSHLQPAATKLCDAVQQWIADPTLGIRSVKQFTWAITVTLGGDAGSYVGMMPTKGGSLLDRAANSAATTPVTFAAGDNSFVANAAGNAVYLWDYDGQLAVMHYCPDVATSCAGFVYADTVQHCLMDRDDGWKKIYLFYTDGHPDVTLTAGTVINAETRYLAQLFATGANAALA